jgi:hypothetical protein
MGISQTLRPLRTGEMLDRAFRLYRNHFILLISIGALGIVPMSLLQVLSQSLLGDSRIVNLLQSVFVISLVQGSLAYAISSAYFGQPLSIGAAYRVGFQRYGSLWGAFFLQGVAIGLPIGVLVGCGVIAMAAGDAGSIVLLLLMLLFVPYAVYLGTRWLLTTPSIILEEVGATAGLRRSWNLTASVFWRVFGVSLLTGLLTFFIAQLPGLLVTYGLAFFFPEAWIGPYIEIVMTGLSLVLALPLSMGVIVLLYYDVRVRREGYDLELQARELAANPN